MLLLGVHNRLRLIPYCTHPHRIFCLFYSVQLRISESGEGRPYLRWKELLCGIISLEDVNARSGDMGCRVDGSHDGEDKTTQHEGARGFGLSWEPFQLARPRASRAWLQVWPTDRSEEREHSSSTSTPCTR